MDRKVVKDNELPADLGWLSLLHQLSCTEFLDGVAGLRPWHSLLRNQCRGRVGNFLQGSASMFAWFGYRASGASSPAFGAFIGTYQSKICISCRLWHPPI